MDRNGILSDTNTVDLIGDSFLMLACPKNKNYLYRNILED